MNVFDVIRRAGAGELAPVYVLVGTESLLIERAVTAIRGKCLADGIPGFNEDILHGKGLAAERVLSIARTVPMMAAQRFVLVRRIDEMSAEDLDSVATYVDDPVPSTCFVATADKIDGRTRFAKTTRKANVLVEVETLKGGALTEFVTSEVKHRGHTVDPRAVSALVDAIGADLSAMDDAIERLSLFVGAGAAIDQPAVEACVTSVRVDSIWALVDGVSARDPKRVLTAAVSLLNDREPALRILAMVARQLRMIARMREGLASGLSAPEAAKHAGAPPFKAQELTAAAKRFSIRDLGQAFRILAETDVTLKSSKRSQEVILEEALLRLTTSSPSSTSRPPERTAGRYSESP